MPKNRRKRHDVIHQEFFLTTINNISQREIRNVFFTGIILKKKSVYGRTLVSLRYPLYSGKISVNLTCWLYAVFDFTSIYFFNRYRFKFYPLQTSNIYCPPVKWFCPLQQFFRCRITRAPKWKDATSSAEKIFRGIAPPLIKYKLLPGCNQVKFFLRYSMI